MTEQDASRPAEVRKVAQQVAYIKDAFTESEIDVEELLEEDGGVSSIHAVGQLLVSDKHLTLVQRLLGQQLDPNPDALEQLSDPLVERVIDDIVLLKLKASLGEGEGKYGKVPVGEVPTVHRAVQIVEEALGAGVVAPNYVLTAAPVVDPCPATEPEEVYDGIEPCPGICSENSGAGVLVYIADTGLLEGAETTFPWLYGVRRALDGNGATQPPDPLGPGIRNGLAQINHYTGHGTFVAGVVRCIAPRADVIVSNIFKIGGSALESDFVKDLAIALGQGVDVFNLSISTVTRNNKPMLAFSRWLRLLRQYKGVACIVAAGNSGVRRPSWPAADARMVAVGALSADWRSRARFSNYGGWVDVYAPGRDLVNAFATGYYQCYEVPYRRQVRDFYGMARWSGTSFSTPIVTGLVADRMSRTGENGQEAAAALLREAHANAIPGVGAVLVPCRGSGNCGCGRHPADFGRHRHHHHDGEADQADAG